MKLIVFDTESTARDGQICQLAYLLIDGDDITGINRFFAADSVSDAAFAIHGMSTERLQVLSGGQRFCSNVHEILADFGSADLLVGHNISADLRMLKLELERLRLPLPGTPSLCTMKHFTPILKLKRLRGPGSPKPPRLDELCAYYAVTDASVSARCREWFACDAAHHDARYDAAATYLCLRAAMEKGDIQI